MDVDGGVCGFDGQTLRELPTDGLSSCKVGRRASILVDGRILVCLLYCYYLQSLEQYLAHSRC